MNVSLELFFDGGFKHGCVASTSFLMVDLNMESSLQLLFDSGFEQGIAHES